MQFIATRVLPILTGLAFLNFFVRIGLTVWAGDATAGYGVFGALMLFFLMILLTIIVGRVWQGRRTTAGEASMGGAGAVGAAPAVMHDPARHHDSGGDLGGGGGFGGGGGDGGGGGGGGGA